jgi:steroid 5-alpha reductase family enzyme
MLHFFVMFGAAFVAVEAVMLLFWVLYCAYRNVSVMDIGWGLGFIAAALVYFILGDGYIWRKILVLTIVSIWALRLVWHLAHRFMLDREDTRYQVFLRKWPLAQNPLLQVLIFFAFIGILITILSLPFALMSQNILPFFSTFEVYGLLIWMGGVVGEAIADYQLYQFRQNPDHFKKVFQNGLWRYSRHPNYFFEWIVWLGYFIMAFSSPFGWVSIISPILMLYLLLKVSGIPPTEAEALETKGDSYRDYQARTSPFFPWFSYQKPKGEET